MKQIQLSLFIFLLLSSLNLRAQIGIGTSTPAASAQLDVSSTTRGLLPPRMSLEERDKIATPVAGLFIWCANCGPFGEMQVYNGTSWTKINGGIASAYNNIPICSQVWMTKNLDVANYRNGDPIPKVTNQIEWNTLTTGAYCYLDNDSATYAATYGKLYNWYAVNDPRGLAPIGWHVPSDAEWTTLSTCLGGVALAGGAMKEAGTSHWLPPNNAATNSSGFTGLPGAFRGEDGVFYGIGDGADFWSSTEVGPAFGQIRWLWYSHGTLGNDYYLKQWGFSVRCLKD